MSSKYSIETDTHDDDSYMYSYTSFSFHVMVNETRDELYIFGGSESSDSSGSSKSGVQEVKINENESWVITLDAEGEERDYPLPVSVEYYENGDKIKILWPSGREEIRERRSMSISTKYGQPILTSLNYPEGRIIEKKKTSRKKKNI